jgi:hypothetical protein
MTASKMLILFLLRRLGIFLLAVVTAYVLASIAATQSVVASLAGMGVDVSLNDRLAMTARDIAGMANMFLPMVAFGLLCAFMTAALLCRWLSQWRTPLYVLAGAAGLLTIHLLLNLAFQITPVAAARSAVGLFFQVLAGAAGGWVYIRLIRPES